MRKLKVYQIWSMTTTNQWESETSGWILSETDLPLPDDVKIVDIELDRYGNPIRGFAEMPNELIIDLASRCYGEFLRVLGYDWTKSPHMADTPRRVARAWVEDLARSDFSDPPKVTDFENDGKYRGMVVVRGIKVNSMCAHHNLPFTGRAHIGYLPGETVIGLSKFNRVVDYISRKPTVQENITQEIHDYLDSVAKGNKGVAVVVEAEHMCVACRGVKDESSDTATQVLSKEFYDDQKTREEFYTLLNLKK